MADILGNSPLSYKHLKAAHEKSPDFLQSYLQNAAAKHGREPHNFNFDLKQLENASTADTVGYMTDNFQTLQTVVDEVMYVENRFREYLPMITVPEGAESWKYRVMDGVGDAVYLEEEGSTAPDSTAALKTVAYNIYYGGAVASWTQRALQKSQHGGIAIDAETMKYAARSALNRMENTLFQGSTEIGETQNGVKGFVNLSAASDAAIAGTQVKIVDVGSGVNNYFSGSSTGDEMAAKLNEWVSAFIEDTKTIIGRQISGGMTLYLPVKQHGIVTTKRLQDINMTVWQYFQTNNAWRNFTNEEIVLRDMIELDGAATSTGKTDRAILALNNVEIMESAVAIEPRVMHMESNLFTVRAPLEFAHSPLAVKRAAGIRYIDGV